MSLPSSPLSSYSSSTSSTVSGSPRNTLPKKRDASAAFSDHSPPPSPHLLHSAMTDSDVSSDTSGSVPGSPGMDTHDDDAAIEQVSVCRWSACNRDLGNMDDLVKHIHRDHIGTRKPEYACQWDGCNRKGMTHASGYALRAHMRSHTKEKPFYCSLPECDRSFTRSDALAKHMRTVHETEALRPSDPVPKSHPNHPQNLFLSSLSSRSRHLSSMRSNNEGDDGSKSFTLQNAGGQSYYLPEDGYDTDEEKLPPKKLLRLLEKKQAWAEQEQRELTEQLEILTRCRRECWIKKEMLLDRVLEQELGPEEAKNVSLKFFDE